MINALIFQQYENIRKSGKCNMFDIVCVKKLARRKAYYALAAISDKEYVQILQEYSQLKEMYMPEEVEK
jgi:hypothetical protein